MSIPARNRDGVTILEPNGKITIGVGDIALRDAVDEALAAGSQSILIDFSRVTRMDSSGMAELVAAYKRISEAGGSIKLLKLPSNIRDVLSITQIARVFDIFDDEDEAVESFSV
jgi:anti-sigma B factor antagonist